MLSERFSLEEPRKLSELMGGAKNRDVVQEKLLEPVKLRMW